MNTEQLHEHFGNWWAVVIWVLLYALFLAFVPFYRKSHWKPAGAYLAFVVAFALEMFGVPASMYMLTWLLGHRLPDGILWGHTLHSYIGYGGMYLALAMFLIGGVFVIAGWQRIHRGYWRHAGNERRMVTDGIYRYIRHPQYTGFLLISLGMICEWATLPLLLMWPILLILYTRLARKEEAEMGEEFGAAYLAYAEHTGSFLPRIWHVPAQTRHVFGKLHGFLGYAVAIIAICALLICAIMVNATHTIPANLPASTTPAPADLSRPNDHSIEYQWGSENRFER